MFSKSCEYAIKAMIFVALKSKNGLRTGMKEISENTNAPLHFVAKIMQDLSRKKLVRSFKGPNGGFYMETRELKSTLAEIVKAVDGDHLFTQCVMGLKKCAEKRPCPVHHEYKVIRKNLIHMLENNTIQEFTDKLQRGKHFLK